MVEEHTRRAVQLRHYNALCSVDDKGAVIGHERNLAHVHFLLFDVFHSLVGRLFIVNDQSHFDAQWCGVRDATQGTFFYVEGGLAQLIINVLKGSAS